MITNSTVASQDEYKERYVAFLDLLGFKALVCAAESDENEHSRLRYVLELLNQTLCSVPRWGFRFSHFSDCIIITSDVAPEALETIFSSVETLTRNLLQYDVLVRGGMTRGGAFHSQQYVYGTAVSRAAVMEKEQAQAPLVLLAPEVYQDVVALGLRLLPWIEVDGPDRHFVHYLVQYAIYHQQARLPGTVSLDVDAERIAFYVSRRLLNDPDGVRDKAQWFQAYWNRTVARPDGFPPIEADPSLTEPDGPRTTIIKRLIVSGG
jgi:hypothetical protein